MIVIQELEIYGLLCRALISNKLENAEVVLRIILLKSEMERPKLGLLHASDRPR